MYNILLFNILILDFNIKHVNLVSYKDYLKTCLANEIIYEIYSTKYR